MRDLRYFSLTNNQRLVKINFSSEEIKTLLDICNLSQLPLYVCYMVIYCQFGTIYCVFLYFECLLDNHEVPCGISDIFPWQTIWDLSKIIFSSEEIKNLLDICNWSESSTHTMYVTIYGHFMVIYYVTQIWVFWTNTRSLVGSQIFFLDKKSETCQNKFQLWGNQNSIGHM